MKRRMSTFNVVLVCLGLATSTGAVGQQLTSRFIEGMPPLEANPDIQGSFRWQQGSVDFGSYDKIMLDRVQFVYADDSPYKGIDPAQLAAIGGSLIHRIQEAMEPEFPVVDKPGASVVRIRIAITEVKVERPKAAKPARGIFGFTPGGLALNTIASAASDETDLSAARVEAEVLDASSGARLAVLVDPEPAKHVSGKGWDALQEAFTFYAGRLRTRFDKAHGR